MPQDNDKIEYPCHSCGTVNRFPYARRLDDPKCGRCGEKVFPRAPVGVTDESWRSEVEECPIPVLAEFWAEWCVPCKSVAPVLEKIAAERAGKLKVVKLNVDRAQRTAAIYGVQSVPTMILLRGPLQVDQIAGAMPKSALDARLDRSI